MNRGVSDGFTIVELLIVIVVIAILASVSVVSFTGIQQRAVNTVIIADAKSMVNIMNQYLAINGSDSLKTIIPADWYSYCIGEGYTDVDPGSGVSCTYYSSDGGATVSTNNSLASIDTALRPLGGYEISKSHMINTTAPSYQRMYTAPTVDRYPTNSYQLDGIPNFLVMRYFLKGSDQDCVLKPQSVYVGSSGGIYNYAASYDARNVYFNAYETQCTLYIPEL